MITLGVDLDHVIADSLPEMLLLLTQQTKIDYTREDVTSFNFHECLEGVSEEAALRMLERFHTDWLEKVRTVEGARDALWRLAPYCYINIITARPLEARIPTLNWLTKKRLPIDRVIFSKDKSKEEFDILIDDSGDIALQTAINIATKSIPSVVLLYDQPWNQSLVTVPHVFRVYNWEEIIRCVIDYPKIGLREDSYAKN